MNEKDTETKLLTKDEALALIETMDADSLRTFVRSCIVDDRLALCGSVTCKTKIHGHIGTRT